MALEKIMKNSSGVPTGEYERIAGGTLYADSPIGTILPFGGADAPAGWMICDGTSLLRASYPELFAVIGTAFGSADSTHFNIPDMRGKFAEGLASGDTLGASKSAGLPNITGHFNADYLHHGGGIWNGAFDGFITDTGSQLMSAGSIDYSTNNAFHFDASKSNSIYGNSNTVQPPSVCVNYIIKAKMIGVPSDFLAKVDEAVEDLCTNTVTSGSTAPITSGGVYASKIFYKTISTPAVAISASGVLGNNVRHEIDENKFTVIGGSFMVTGNSDSAKVWGNVHAWSSGGKVYYTYHSDIAQTVSGVITLYYVVK